MNENLPVNMDESIESGAITYANEVIATIVGVATAEVEGVTGMASSSSSITELLSGRSSNKGVSRGVKVEVGAEEASVDVSIVVDYGTPIQKVGRNVQENVRKSIETMTGLHVINVDVHVVGVSFEKENRELEQGQEFARIQANENIKADNDSVIITEDNTPLATQADDLDDLVDEDNIDATDEAEVEEPEDAKEETLEE